MAFNPWTRTRLELQAKSVKTQRLLLVAIANVLNDDDDDDDDVGDDLPFVVFPAYASRN